MAAEIGAIHLNHTGHHAGLRVADGFPDSMGHHKCCFLLHVQVAAELQGANPLNSVNKDRDCGQIVADGQFAAGEDRAAGYAKQVAALFALP